MNIQDKENRKALIERYLNADTTPEEERHLRAYYNEASEIDADEKAVALLMNISAPSAEAYSQTKVDEYDRLFGGDESAETEPSHESLTSKPANRRGVIFKSLYAFAACAAAVALSLIFRPKAPATDFTPLEIAQSISALAELNSEDVESVAAKPTGSGVIVTVVLKEGKCSDFWMARDGETGEIQLLAMNDK